MIGLLALLVVAATLTWAVAFWSLRIWLTNRILCPWARGWAARIAFGSCTLGLMLSCIINLLVPRRSFLPVGAVVATLALAWVYCWWRWHKQLPRAMAVAERADRLQDYREKQEAQAKVLEAFRMIIRYGADIGDLYLPGQLPTDTKYAYLAVPPSLVPDDLLTDS